MRLGILSLALPAVTDTAEGDAFECHSDEVATPGIASPPLFFIGLDAHIAHHEDGLEGGSALEEPILE